MREFWPITKCPARIETGASEGPHYPERVRSGAIAAINQNCSTIEIYGRPLWILVIFLLGLHFAPGATLTAQLDRQTMNVGETATFSLTFSGANPQNVPTLPAIPNLQFNYIGPATQFSYINGQVTSTVTHNFAVRATQPGDFVIPVLETDVGGEKLRTQPLKLKVLKPGPPSAEAINSGTQLAFLKLVLPKNQVYVGESIVFELDLYLANTVRNIRNFQLPSFPFDGCNIGKMVQGNQRKVQVGNALYTVIPLSYPLKAIKSGPLKLGSIVTSVVVETSRRRRDAFDQFPFDMFGGENREVSVATEPDTLEALPLPTDNVPPGFNGAVGSFSITMNVAPTNVAAGDPITVRVALAGHGAFDALTLPDQPQWHDFKTYPPTSKVETTDPFGLEGSKTFEEVLVPLNSDVKELVPVAFSFFDPDAKAYRSLVQPPVKLTVRPSGAAPAPTVAAANRSAPESPPAQDIVPLKMRLGVVGQIGPPLLQQPWFIGVQAVPVAAFVFAVIWRRRAENLANNPRLRRQRKVAQMIDEGVKELRQFALQNQSDQFFATLFRLLQERLGERLDLPASSITEAVIDEQLKPRKIPELLINQLQELFNLCNLARYSPIKSSAELAALIPRVEQALRELETLRA